MASYTPNLNLYKPDDSDDYKDFREGFNDNMNILDQGGGGGNQNIATNYDDTQTYTRGDYVIENGVLYKCVTAVTTPESFDPTKWTHVVVTDEMGGGGGSGDTVTWNQIQQSGTKIAEIDINGTSQDVYAPQGGGSGGHTIYDPSGNALAQESGLQFTGAVSVSDDSVNGRTVVDVEGGGDYYLNTIYSTEEKKVGYWTNGKPLYAKTIPFTTSSSSNTTDFAHGISDIDEIPFYKGTLNRGDGTFVNINLARWQGNGDDLIGCQVNKTNISIFVNYSNYRNKVVNVTLLYTKTTDTADPNPQFGNVIYLPTIYSDEEREVGVWIDGKPLYQKTVYFGQLTNNTSKSIAHGIANVDRIIKTESSVLENDTYFFNLPFVNNPTYDIAIWCDRTNITITPYSDRTSDFAYVTLWYTKTTDTKGSGDWTPSGARAVHYSTNEQVIGTWIDGKPLYERTITISSVNLPATGNTSITLADYGVTNIAKIVNMSAHNETLNLPLPYLVWYGNLLYTLTVSTETTTTLLFSRNGGALSNQTFSVTLQYTKTTD